MTNKEQWDSFGTLVGATTRPTDSRFASPRSLNMDWRWGNCPRRGLMSMKYEFENPDDRVPFTTGNVQRVDVYNAYGNRPTALIYLIAGNIYAGFISASSIFIRRLFSGFRPDAMLGWICQGFEWLVVQNGSDKPFIWDGADGFQSDPSKAQMPIGGPMVFIHHSIAVCSSDGNDKIAVSDRWTQTRSSNVWKFVDTPTWDNAGVFGLHANFGKIMTLAVLPQIKQTPNGQGDMLICGTNGAQTLNLQIARDQILNSQVQDTALIGSGFASAMHPISVNSSMYFVGEKGLREVLRSRSDFEQNDYSTTESGDIDLYWNAGNSNFRLFTPLGHYDDQLFIGLLPETTPCATGGSHRFCKAWATLDVSERYRQGQRLPRAWNGLQCGIRPVEYISDVLVNRVHRSFVVSHDADGINRTYEVTNWLTDDIVDGAPKPIRSFFVSPLLGIDKDDTLKAKMPRAVRIDYKDAEQPITVGLEWKADNSMCWNPWGIDRRAESAESISRFELPQNYGDTLAFSDPAKRVDCKTTPPSRLRLKIRMTGRANLENIYFGMAINPNPKSDLRVEASRIAVKKVPTCAENLELYHLP